jgi:hypothetical protein
MQRSWQWVIGLLVSISALALAFQGVNLTELGNALTQARYEFIVPALVCVWLGQWLRAQSWRVILGHQLTHTEVFSALNAGYLLNNLLPLRLGELGRAYLISRTGKMTVSQALSSVVVERVVDLCMVSGILFAFLPTVAFQGWALNAGYVAIAIVAVALLGLYLSLIYKTWMLKLVRWAFDTLLWFWSGRERIEEMVSAFIDGMESVRQPKRFFGACIFSAGAWISAGLGTTCVIAAFNPILSVSEWLTMGFFTLTVTALSIALPSAPGSLGVWQWAVVLALSVFGISRETALSVALVNHLSNYVVTSVLGALALSREHETLTHLAQSARSLIGKTAERRV